MNRTRPSPETNLTNVFSRVGVQSIRHGEKFLNVDASRFFCFSHQDEAEETIDPRWIRFIKIRNPQTQGKSAWLTAAFADLQRAERERNWLLEGAKSERFHSFIFAPRTMTPFMIATPASQRRAYSAADSDASEVFAALRPSFATLSVRRNLVILRRLLASPSVWFDADLATWPEWGTRSGNLVLVVVSAACHIGALRFRGGMWAVTSFGRDLASRWTLRDPLSESTESWNEVMAADFVRATHWAWDILLNEPYRSLFYRLTEPALGWMHEDLPSPLEISPTNERLDRDQRWRSLTCVAAAAALGAIWFTGARWEPQMLGSYLACHPDSPLRRL